MKETIIKMGIVFIMGIIVNQSAVYAMHKIDNDTNNDE